MKEAWHAFVFLFVIGFVFVFLIVFVFVSREPGEGQEADYV